MLDSVLIETSSWLSPYRYQMVLAVMATMLVLFGDKLNKALKKQMRGMHIVLRTVIFVFVCAFGYGLLTVWLAEVFHQLLLNVPTKYLSLIALGAFVSLGLYAQKQNQI